MDFKRLILFDFSFTEIFPEGRSMPLQAGFQVLGLVVTLFIAVVTGAATGKNNLIHILRYLYLSNDKLIFSSIPHLCSPKCPEFCCSDTQLTPWKDSNLSCSALTGSWRSFPVHSLPARYFLSPLKTWVLKTGQQHIISISHWIGFVILVRARFVPAQCVL